MSIDTTLQTSAFEFLGNRINEIEDNLGFLQMWCPNISRLKLLICVNENIDFIAEVIDLLSLVSKVLNDFKNLHKNGLYAHFVISNLWDIEDFETMMTVLTTSIPVENINLDISTVSGFQFDVINWQNPYNQFNFQHFTKSTTDISNLFTTLRKYTKPPTETKLCHFKETLHIECVLKLNLSFVRKLEIQCFELYTSDLLKICQACREMHSLKITLDPKNHVDLQSLLEELMIFCPLITCFEYKSSIFFEDIDICLKMIDENFSKNSAIEIQEWSMTSNTIQKRPGQSPYKKL